RLLRTPLLVSSFFLTCPPPPPSSPLSLHDALPICFCGPPTPPDQNTANSGSRACSRLPRRAGGASRLMPGPSAPRRRGAFGFREDRKSTRLNSSHSQISYAVFCLKKKKKNRGHHAT